ncbi:hypothetical protein L6R53_04650 [Myxococcota bacterium]|nr:hypothetical protein [Myxococcota bacterium]
MPGERPPRGAPWSRRELLAVGGGAALALALRPSAAWAGRLRTHDPEAGSLLSQALDSPTFWQGASVKTFDDRLYDEVRLKSLDEGYLAMVTGEGGRDFDAATVVRTVNDNMQRLPEVEDGAKAVVRLGEGTDGTTGLPFVDSFYYLDFTFFYGVYSQRMYKLVDGSRTILFFEKLTTEMAGAAWPIYDKRIVEVMSGVKRRSVFGSVVPVSKIFGMFVVSPGATYRSRVTFTTKIHFGEGTGMLARMGSDMPPVIRAGLQSGFDSCVAIASKVADGG